MKTKRIEEKNAGFPCCNKIYTVQDILFSCNHTLWEMIFMKRQQDE
jgi:hypothetical protein